MHGSQPTYSSSAIATGLAVQAMKASMMRVIRTVCATRLKHVIPARVITRQSDPEPGTALFDPDQRPLNSSCYGLADSKRRMTAPPCLNSDTAGGAYWMPK